MKNAKNINTYLTFTIFLLHAFHSVRCLHLIHVEIPEYVDIRDVVTLSCSYNMGRDKLNSIKWYKDKQEFFRYAPMMDQQISTWTVDGVNLYKEHPFRCNKQA
ncbi:CLUMA_CG003053, isoform A, partial [Clunio marinus]